MARLALLALLVACTTVYDADDFGVCEIPDFSANPPCDLDVASCLATCENMCREDEECLSECTGACYDANGDGTFDPGELSCARCVSFLGGLRCIREAGCTAEADALHCCIQALCDPVLGCTAEQCADELEALETCAATQITPGACDMAYLDCFSR